MKLLDNLPFGAKIALAPFVCLLLLTLSSAWAVWGFSRQHVALASLIDERIPSYTFAAKFESGLRDMNGLINQSLSYESMGYAPKEIASVDERLKRTSTELKTALTDHLRTRTNAADQEGTQSLIAGFAKYAKAVDATLDVKSAGATLAGSLLTTAQSEYEALLKQTSRISQARLDEAARDAAAAGASAMTAQISIGIAAGIAVLTGTLLCVLLTRGLLRRVTCASAAVAALADGDLTHRIEDGGRDELGRLMTDLETVRSRLDQSLHGVLQASESVQVAAREIASGNADLSQRTEFQASSLQQTSSSMEEINATVRGTAEAARQAGQMVLAASDVAGKGGSVVGQVITTMDNITASSRKIAEIIGTVDGIAFQTNILALNAAVEAARAGEQGRGFAVVAGEVRSLAQRSAGAAKEIKSLITDSVQTIENGSRLVGEAGRTMAQIVDQVAKVKGLIGEIESSTQQQTAGIDQVSTEVARLDEMTQQNSALVEQAAAAAASLDQQAAKLVETVAGFKVSALDPSVLIG